MLNPEITGKRIFTTGDAEFIGYTSVEWSISDNQIRTRCRTGDFIEGLMPALIYPGTESESFNPGNYRTARATGL